MAFELRLIAVGKRLPSWAETAVAEFAKRFVNPWTFKQSLISVSNQHQEATKIIQACQDKFYTVALDVKGEAFATEKLATNLNSWQESYRGINFIIGGPDGLTAECKNQANKLWSLSKLTLPHALARVVLVEQLYRAQSVLLGHPYHRA